MPLILPQLKGAQAVYPSTSLAQFVGRKSERKRKVLMKEKGSGRGGGGGGGICGDDGKAKDDYERV